MSTNHDLSAFEPSRARREIAHLLRQMHELTLELAALRERGGRTSELHAKETDLEQLRWRLAIAARRTATAGLSALA